MIASGTLLDNLQTARLGQYQRLAQGFENSLLFDLRTASIADLKTIQGVGDKTARYFILHTRANQKIAVLDRHVLRYMRDKGYDVPKAGTPNGKKYLELEKSFLAEAQLEDMTPADFDLMLWNKYSKVVKT